MAETQQQGLRGFHRRKATGEFCQDNVRNCKGGKIAAVGKQNWTVRTGGWRLKTATLCGGGCHREPGTDNKEMAVEWTAEEEVNMVLNPEPDCLLF